MLERLRTWLCDAFPLEDRDAPPSAAAQANGPIPPDALREGGRGGRASAFRVGGATLTGPRPKNDDSYRIDGSAGLIAVSDGISGAPDGDVMSRVATGSVLEAYAETHDLARAFTAANDAAAHVAHLIDNDACGATLLAAAYDETRLAIAWAGDTIAYRLRDGLLEQLADAERADGTSALTAAVGYDYGLAPSTAVYDIAPGDRFLFCTDGVWEPYLGELGGERLIERMSEHDNASLLARAVVEEAAGAGTDNATAVVLIADARSQAANAGPGPEAAG